MRVVVIGATAAGTSAAAKARRVDPEAEVVLLERGAHVSVGACGLPYALAGQVADFHDLVARTPEQFEAQGIDVRLRHEVVAVDSAARGVVARSPDGGEVRLPYDALVLATGASPVWPELPGVDLPGVRTLRSLADGLELDALVAGARSAVILGGGYLGLETAEALAARGLAVTLLQRGPHVLADFDPDLAGVAEAELAAHGVAVRPNTTALGFEGDGHVRRVLTADGALDADLVLLGLGVRPNVDLALGAGVALGETGAVAVAPDQRTNVEGIFAAGDVAEAFHRVLGRPVYAPLGTTANKQGRVAGANAAGGRARFGGVVGTAILKVFGRTFARTGLSLRQAREAGFDAAHDTVHTTDRARYYPGAAPLTVRLVHDRPTGRLLGAQLVGHGDAPLRVDVVAALLARGANLEELAELDLAYAPPFSTVWDPLLVAAQVALRGRD